MSGLHLLGALILLGVAMFIVAICLFAAYSVRLQNRTDNWVDRWNEAARNGIALDREETEDEDGTVEVPRKLRDDRAGRDDSPELHVPEHDGRNDDDSDSRLLGQESGSAGD